MRYTIRRLYVLIVPMALIGCSAQRYAPSAPEPTSMARVISEGEIQGSGAVSAHDAITRLRPRFLLSPRDRTSTVVTQVYVDGVRIGGIEALRSIPSSTVREIRWLDGREATIRFGMGHGAGALIISSKPGTLPQ